MLQRALLLLLLVSSLSFGSAFEPTAKWKKKEVRVCWLTPKVFKHRPQLVDDEALDEKAKVVYSLHLATVVQEKVNQEFTVSKTGIHFSGWKLCELDRSLKIKNADAILSFDQVNEASNVIEGASSIGMSVQEFLEAPVRRKPNSISLPTLAIHLPDESLYDYENQKVSYSDAVVLSALHEFGHLAGLVHEHMAFIDDALQDPRCFESDFGDFFKSSVQRGRSFSKDYVDYNLELRTALKTTYDSFSIMNYCHLYQKMKGGFEISAISLSQHDNAMLKSVYSQ